MKTYTITLNEQEYKMLKGFADTFTLHREQVARARAENPINKLIAAMSSIKGMGGELDEQITAFETKVRRQEEEEEITMKSLSEKLSAAGQTN